jgi:hypothetical protein
LFPTADMFGTEWRTAHPPFGGAAGGAGDR